MQNSILNVLFKFQVDMFLYDEAMADATFESFCSSVCGCHVGGQRNVHQSVFPYNIIENLSNSIAHNSSTVDSNDFKFDRKTKLTFLRTMIKLEMNCT